MVKKQVNKKVVVGLSLGAFALMLVLSIIMLRQLKQRNPEYFIEFAERYEGEEQWFDAATFYNEAWQRSHDAHHLVDYGRMLMRLGEVNRAVAAWNEALVNEPNLIDAHQTLLDTLLEYGRLYGQPERWKRVKDAADSFIAVAQEDDIASQATANHALGLALTNLTTIDPDNAGAGVDHLKNATSLAPNNLDFAVDLAFALVRQGRKEEAEELFQGLIRTHGTTPECAKVHLAFGNYLARQRRYDQAALHYEKSLSLSKSDAEAQLDARIAYATFLSRQWARGSATDSDDETVKKLFDDAESIFKECLVDDPDGSDAPLQLATLYKASRKFRESVDVCRTRLQKGFSRVGIERARNQLHMFNLMIMAAEGALAEGILSDPITALDIREKWLDEALQFVADARGEFPSHPRVRSVSGRIKLAKGQDRAALEDLRAADEGFRSFNVIDRENKIILARLHLRLSEPGAAKAVLDEVLSRSRDSIPTDNTFWMLYGQTLFETSELEPALRIADRILSNDPDNLDAKRLKAAIFERHGKLEQAGEIMRNVPDADILHALLVSRERTLAGDYEGAISVLKDALQKNPTQPRLVSTTVYELIKLDRNDEASEIINHALSEEPNNATFRRLAALTAKDLSIEQRTQATLDVIQDEEDGYQRELNLIDFYSRQSDLAKMLVSINRALSHLTSRDTPTARTATIAHHRAMLKAKLLVAAQLKDTGALIEARDLAIKLNVDGAGGSSLVGLYHMYRQEFDQAMAAFREAVAAQPTDSHSLARLGQCLHSINRIDDARAYYERAVRVNPKEGWAHRGLAILAISENDTEAYERELAVCERLIPGDKWIRGQLIARREKADPQAAIASREARLEQNPDEVENLQRLAALNEMTGNIEKADSYHDKLVALQPDDLTVFDTTSKYYRRTSRPDRALAIATGYLQTRTTNDDKASAHMLIARHHLKQNELMEAETEMLTAVDLAPTLDNMVRVADFYASNALQPSQAIPWLVKATELARASQSPMLPRILGTHIACLLHRTVNETAQARKRVDEFREAFPNEPRGLLWDAEVHARVGNIGEAIASLTDYLGRIPDDSYARFQRAQFYHSQGKIELAIEDLVAVKRADPMALQLEPRLRLAQLYDLAGRTTKWIAELEQLVEENPDSAKSMEALVRAYIKEDRLKEADQVVTKQINRGGSTPDSQWLFLRALVSFEMEDWDKAIADCKLATMQNEYDSESVARVLEAYIRSNRSAQGAEFYEQHKSDASKSAIVLSRYARMLATADRRDDAIAPFREAMSMAMFESAATVALVSGDLLASMTPEVGIPLFDTDTPTGVLGQANDRILVRFYRSAKRTQDAAGKIDRLIASANNERMRGRLWHEKAELYHVAGDGMQAKSCYEEALKYDPDNWVTLNNFAYLLADDLNEHERARPYAEAAAAIIETNATLDTLGWIYVGVGEYSLAIAELSRAIRLNPEQAHAHFHLGEAYRRNAQFEEADRVLKAALTLVQAQSESDLAQQIETALLKTKKSDNTP